MDMQSTTLWRFMNALPPPGYRKFLRYHHDLVESERGKRPRRRLSLSSTHANVIILTGKGDEFKTSPGRILHKLCSGYSQNKNVTIRHLVPKTETTPEADSIRY
jgi:hypothetical protein